MAPVSPVTPSPSGFGNFRPDLAEGMKPFSEEMLNAGLIGLEIAPAIEMDESSGDIGLYRLGDLLRPVDTSRASGAPYKMIDFSLADFQYSTKDHGVVVPIDDRKVKLLRNRFSDLERFQALLARQIVMTSLEKRIYDAVLDATVMTGALTDSPSNEWDDLSNADPISDIREFSYQVWKNCGFTPTALALSYFQYLNLRDNPKVLARISASGAGDKIKPSDVTLSMLAQALGLEKILVSRRPVNTAAKGAAMALEPLWPDDEALLYVPHPGNGDPFAPGFAGTYHWGEDGSTIGGTIETDGDWDHRSTKVRCRMDTDEKKRYPEMGFRITGLTTSEG